MEQTIPEIIQDLIDENLIDENNKNNTEELEVEDPVPYEFNAVIGASSEEEANKKITDYFNKTFKADEVISGNQSNLKTEGSVKRASVTIQVPGKEEQVIPLEILPGDKMIWIVEALRDLPQDRYMQEIEPILKFISDDNITDLILTYPVEIKIIRK